MGHTLLLLLALISSHHAIAEDNPKVDTTNYTSNREALLKAAVARDRGEITAMEPSSQASGGVIIGYSSGAVLNCYGDHSCKEFGGTPNAAVEHIAVTRQAQSEVIWVSYPHGGLYRCMRKECSKFLWDGVQGK